MNTELIYILIIIIISLFVLAVLIKKWLNDLYQKENISKDLIEWLKSTNTRIDEQNTNITSTLQASTKALNERLDNAARFIAQVQKNIGEMSEIGRGMKELGDFLKSPKLRGNIGELLLRDLLREMFPKQSFSLQYQFKTGSIVDAIIKTGGGILPVDSKFPLENFQKMVGADKSEQKNLKEEFEKSVKKHIDDISRKYILTEEGTLDYALMYLPSETIYYEVVNNPQLFEYAQKKSVMPVSPMTFYAFMRAILLSLEGLKIERETKQILNLMNAIRRDYGKVEETVGIMGKHLTNAYNQLNNVFISLGSLGNKLDNVNSLSNPENKTLKLEERIKNNGQD